MSRMRIIKHESVPETGSYEVRFPDVVAERLSLL
jgi:hypothetical protein